MKRGLLTLVSAVLCGWIAGCGGGGGGGNDEAGTGAGFYAGEAADGRSILAAVMPNGMYYVLYGSGVAPYQYDGFIQGSGSFSNGKFISASGTDFNFAGSGTSPITVNAKYEVKSSLEGSVSNSNGSLGFKATYDNEFEKMPSSATITGTYNGMAHDAIGLHGVAFQIDANGNITGTVSGCNLTGLVVPLSQGNGYAVTANFTGGACALNTEPLVGAAFFDTRDNNIIVGLFNGARTYGTVIDAAK